MSAKPSRGDTKLLAEKAAAGSGNFLNSKDFAIARRIRPLKWIYKGKVVDMMSYLEGWIDVKGKEHGSPIRFELDEEIPDRKWKMSDGFKGQSPKPQVPQAAIAFLCYDYKTQSVKLVTFTQKTVINLILAWLDEEVAGQPNELYVEDLSEIDIIITKGEKAYTVISQPIKTKIDIDELLDGFVFSWEAFMQCDDCFDDQGEISYNDVKELMVDNEPQPTKKKTKKEPEPKEEEEEEEEIDWENTLSPQGKKLGSFSDEKLLQLYEHLKDRKADTSSTLFRSVIIGCEKRELIEIPF